jgi:two-component system response regulator PilR (NtrC family)
MGKKIAKVSSYAIDLLHKYDFPGNIRELENLMERSVALSNTKIILPDSLALSIHKRRWGKEASENRFDMEEVKNGVSLDSILEDMEKAYIEKALECSDGKKQRAAELLGISFRSIRHRINKFDLNKKNE